jgi:hypothetical protein
MPDKTTIINIDGDNENAKQELPTWYNLAEGFDKWRVFPRLLIALYGIAFYRTTEWFMSLPDPTSSQSAFVSVIVGAGAGWFAVYVGRGSNK